MEMQRDDVESQVLLLDDESRARLAVRLIQSLDSDLLPPSAQVDTLWLDEAEERLRRMESGNDPGIEVGEAISEARNNLNR